MLGFLRSLWGKEEILIGERDLIDQLAVVDELDVEKDFIVIPGKGVIRFWWVEDFPPQLSREVVEQILTFPGQLHHSLIVEPMDPAEALRAIKSARMLMRTTQALQRKADVLADYRVEMGAQEVEEDLAKLQLSNIPPKKLLWVMAMAALDPEELDYKSKRLEELLLISGLRAHRATFRQLQALQCLLPQGYNALGEKRNVWLDNVAGLFPFGNWGLEEPRGLPVGIHRVTGEWIILDDFAEENPNMLIIGEQRSGKSVFLKVKILYARARGWRVFIVDREGEYKRLVERLEGAYFDLGLKSEHSLNILDVNPFSPEGFDETLHSLLAFLDLACGKLTPLEENIAIDAFLTIMDAAGIKRDDPSTWKRTPPVLADLYGQIQAMGSPHALDLAERLKQYAVGIYREAFSCHTNVPPGDLVAFGLRDVPERMRPLRIFQVLSYIWARVLSEMKPTLVLVDEAWDWLRNPQAVRGLEEIARRFPKRYGGLQLATQHAGDLASSKAAEVIRDTAAYVLLFHQRPSAAKRLAEVFPLRPQDINELQALGKGEGLLIARRRVIPIYVPVPPNWWPELTTSPREILAMEENNV